MKYEICWKDFSLGVLVTLLAITLAGNACPTHPDTAAPDAHPPAENTQQSVEQPEIEYVTAALWYRGDEMALFTNKGRVVMAITEGRNIFPEVWWYGSLKEFKFGETSEICRVPTDD